MLENTENRTEIDVWQSMYLDYEKNLIMNKKNIIISLLQFQKHY